MSYKSFFKSNGNTFKKKDEPDCINLDNESSLMKPIDNEILVLQIQFNGVQISDGYLEHVSKLMIFFSDLQNTLTDLKANKSLSECVQNQCQYRFA